VDYVWLVNLLVYLCAIYVAVLIFLHVLGQFYNFEIKVRKLVDEINRLLREREERFQQKVMQKKSEVENDAKMLAEGLKKIKGES